MHASTVPTTPDARFDAWAEKLGHRFDGELVIGGNYNSTIRHGNQVFVSGQIPRIGTTVMVTGEVGQDVSLAQAKVGAQICAMRALVLLKSCLGSLSHIEQALRMTVYTRSSPTFTQQSEVADAASQVLHARVRQPKAKKWSVRQLNQQLGRVNLDFL